MLLDASVLVSTLDTRHVRYEIGRSAIRRLEARRQELFVVPQNLFEFWVVATRPVQSNGLGMVPRAVALELNKIKYRFELLPDDDRIYPVWEHLVVQHQVLGKPAHDARLVAAMYVHDLSEILTFNTSDFKRFPGISAINPNDVR